MSNKKVTSVSIDQRVYEQLKEDQGVNFSGLVNQIAREYVETGSVDGLDIRIREVKNEIEELEEELEKKHEKLQELEEEREKRKCNDTPEMEKAVDVVSNLMQNGHADVDNPAVKTQAQKVGMSPQALLEHVEEQMDDPAMVSNPEKATGLTDGGRLR